MFPLKDTFYTKEIEHATSCPKLSVKTADKK